MNEDIVYFFSVGCLLGGIANELPSYMGLGYKGVQYYSDAHKGYMNKFVHCTCTPIIFYGMSHWVVGLLSKALCIKKRHYVISSSILGFYFFHYLSIDLLITVYFMLVFGGIIWKTITNERNIYQGLVISTIFVLIQEYCGHCIYDNKSNPPERLFNSILYAPFFASTPLTHVP